METVIQKARKELYKYLVESGALSIDARGIPSIADSSSNGSKKISCLLLKKIAGEINESPKMAGQSSGNNFEKACKEYLEKTFLSLSHIRPGDWKIHHGGGVKGIAQFVQYEHLDQVNAAIERDPTLATSIGPDYLIKPDIVITRLPENDETINKQSNFVGRDEAQLTAIRQLNNSLPILHASVSCKWTIRSDRSQNARSEALNLIRNRKGHAPHVVVISAEPMPGRLASIAMGTGDIDCVYHIALPELREALVELNDDSALDTLDILVNGKRLKDISDLPLDLAI